MTSKKPGITLLFILSVMMLAFVAVSCNNNESEKKEDAAKEKMEAMPDSTHMDTATTRPVKTTD